MASDPLSPEYDGLNHRDHRSPRSRQMQSDYALELAERTENMPRPTTERDAELTAAMKRAWRTPQ